MVTKSLQLHDPGGIGSDQNNNDDAFTKADTRGPNSVDGDVGSPAKKGDTDNGVAVVRTTVNLQPEAVIALREIANDRGTTVAEVIRRAIWIEKYLHDAMKAGGKVLLQEPDRTLRELVIR